MGFVAFSFSFHVCWWSSYTILYTCIFLVSHLLLHFPTQFLRGSCFFSSVVSLGSSTWCIWVPVSLLLETVMWKLSTRFNPRFIHSPSLRVLHYRAGKALRAHGVPPSSSIPPLLFREERLFCPVDLILILQDPV